MSRFDSTPLSLSDSAANREATYPRLDRRWIYLALGLLIVGYGLLTLNGYGNHDDIYRMIGTWRTLLSEQRYVPSRFQGYLIPELAIGLSSQIGDFYASNLVSAILAIASLALFYRLLVKQTSPLIALLAAAAVGTNPYWIIAATTSTDYLYPVFFFLGGLVLLVEQRFRWAGVLFACATSSRITYAPMAAIALAFSVPYLQPQAFLRRRFFQGVALFFVGSVLLYLPVFFASGMSLSFLKYADDASGGLLGTIARFFYKNVYFWGLPTFLVIAFFLGQHRHSLWQQLRKNPFQSATPEKSAFFAVICGLIYSEVWFAKLPHQYQYLIPVLLCVVYLVTRIGNLRKQIICFSLIAALHLVYAVCNFDVLETYQNPGANNTIHSDGAVVRPGIREGVLVRDVRWRSIYQRRLTEAFNQQWQHVGRPLGSPR